MSFLQKMKTSLEPVSGIPVLGENKPEWTNAGVTITRQHRWLSQI